LAFLTEIGLEFWEYGAEVRNQLKFDFKDQQQA